MLQEIHVGITYAQTHILISAVASLQWQFMNDKIGWYFKQVNVSKIKVLLPATELLDDPEVFHRNNLYT